LDRLEHRRTVDALEDQGVRVHLEHFGHRHPTCGGGAHHSGLMLGVVGLARPVAPQHRTVPEFEDVASTPRRDEAARIGRYP
jgi:hypothetical protein